ncbi:DUF4255 domain-containing protein [Chryseobacterium arthrosphaerae]|uniref:DUF4255 domain-containing protein n=1 Tax=Chryseobacterium arthrosphaerae TaxID=651561 RepID=A0ABU7R4I5_9FLAO|nr:DUF4255 domain-containing protein [Chryseobacterium arthrosphaerae]
MINKVLTVLKDHLNNSGEFEDIPGEIVVVLDDISKHDSEASGIENKVVITLVNVEEESTLKNSSRYLTPQTQEEINMESTPAYLNLYAMVSANRSSYAKSLANISKVIEIFQTNSTLNYQDDSDDRTKDFSFRIELHSVPFEQLSYVWGLLGGKVMPSVLYKISIIKIVAKNTTSVKLIKDVNIKEFKIN